MTFRVSLLIDADGKAAIVGINRVGDAMRKARGETEKLGTASETTTGKTDRLSTAQKTAAQTSLALAQSQRIAAGSVGNLAAQFNDIGPRT